MPRTRSSRTSLVALTTLPFLLAFGLSGCGGDETSGQGAQQGTRQSPDSTGGSRNAPAGWTQVNTEGLSFAYPPGLRPRLDAERARSDASVELGGEISPDVPIAPALFVFVERGQVGDIATRAQVIATNNKAQLGIDPIGQPKVIPNVAGATGALVLEYDWDYQRPQDKKLVPSRQYEILVQTKDGPQYGIRFGAPKAFVARDMMRTLYSTLRVGSAPSQG